MEYTDGCDEQYRCASALYLCQLFSQFQLSGSNIFDSQMQMHTGNQKDGVILYQAFQHHLTKEHLQKWCF